MAVLNDDDRWVGKKGTEMNTLRKTFVSMVAVGFIAASCGSDDDSADTTAAPTLELSLQALLVAMVLPAMMMVLRLPPVMMVRMPV